MEAQKWKSTLKNLFAKISETESCAPVVVSKTGGPYSYGKL